VELPALDTTLLGGFRFECRPSCGLCCFASPAVTVEERTRLLQIEPMLPVVEGDGGWSFLDHRPNGGACSLLTDLRCGAHPARPAPCAEFPVTVHVSDRAQATLVFSCPGIEPSGILRWADGPPQPAPFVGLTGEVEAARREWLRSGSVRELERHRVKFRPRRGDDAAARLRKALHETLPWPEAADFPPEDPPDSAESMSELPLTFSPRHGRLAFAAHPGGWMLLALSETGEEPRTLAVVPPPESRPAMSKAGERVLRGYLHYLVERDDLLDGVLAQPDPEGPVVMAEQADLIRTAATALARASVLQRLDGRDGPLDASDVWNGVRATDAEWLDRPTTGRRF
jgi:Fe-S-cluster containining protein